MAEIFPCGHQMFWLINTGLALGKVFPGYGAASREKKAKSKVSLLARSDGPSEWGLVVELLG